MEFGRYSPTATRVVAAEVPVSYDVFVAPLVPALSGDKAVVMLEMTMPAYMAYLGKFGASVSQDVVGIPQVGFSGVDDSLSGDDATSGSASVSVRSSVSSGRARRRANKRAQVARAKFESQSDVTYTGQVPAATDDGFCYLRMIKADCAGTMHGKVGPRPTFEQILALPSDVLVGDWDRLKVSGNHGVYHVATTGMVALPLCLASVAAKGVWRVGSVGHLMISMRLRLSDVLVEKAPLLSDCLAGENPLTAAVVPLEVDERPEVRLHVTQWNLSNQTVKGRVALFASVVNAEKMKKVYHVRDSTEVSFWSRSGVQKLTLDQARDYARRWKEREGLDAPLVLIMRGNEMVGLEMGNIGA